MILPRNLGSTRASPVVLGLIIAGAPKGRLSPLIFRNASGITGWYM
ncbi:MAG: hypothetical protein NTX84_08835 [Nitrospirae bacterium]|nr:hypothetical protein [Nitrospirota bacterium]